MRAVHLRALALVVLVLSVSLAGGAASAQAAGKPASGPSVSAALASLQRSGAIAPAVYQQDYSAYVAAVNSLKKLSGTRRAELGAVIANVQAIAAAGGFIPSRLPALFLTLERNRTWWTTGSLLASRVRISFPGSQLVWEYYAGQGIEIQWLGTFGEGNGYYSGGQNNNLKQLVAELIPLATKRAGGIAWEYMFQFDGGAAALDERPLAGHRAAGALARLVALQRTGRSDGRPGSARDLQDRRRRRACASRARWGALPRVHLRSHRPHPQRGNPGSWSGCTTTPRSRRTRSGLQLFEAGDAEERVRTPLYDTGAWSMYDQFGESDLNYHELLTEFLQHLCERTRRGEPLTAAAPPAPAPRAGTRRRPLRRRPGRGRPGVRRAARRKPAAPARRATRPGASATTHDLRRSPGTRSTARRPNTSPPTCTRRR